jgi:orsellinic acid C2-O-methyltransferase
MNEKENLPQLSLSQKLMESITGSWRSQALFVAAELGLADLLRNGPRTKDDLAATTGVHAQSLHRLLRALTTIEICRETEDGLFEITSMGSLLGSDVSGSLRSWAIWWGSNLWPVWGNLLYSIRTGESARKLLTGTDGFKHLEQDSASAATFNQALVELTRLIADRIVMRYDFSKMRQVVDVGGGYGELLATIIRNSSICEGVLFDLPHAVKGGKCLFKQAGLAGRCKCVEGDFFQSVPEGADAYILKSILHDWDDDDARRILSNCRRAMPQRGRLLLVERILPKRLDVSVDHQALARSDLTMLVALASQERTLAQFQKLLQSAGLEVIRIVPLGMTFSVIEACSLQ